MKYSRFIASAGASLVAARAAPTRRHKTQFRETVGEIGMKWKKLSEEKWYNGAVVACIGVAFYVLLTNFGAVLSGLGGFLGNFKAVFVTRMEILWQVYTAINHPRAVFMVFPQLMLYQRMI